MENLIGILVLAGILAAAAGYMLRAKKSGAKCIGCPGGCRCGKKDGCGGTHCG